MEEKKGFFRSWVDRFKPAEEREEEPKGEETPAGSVQIPPAAEEEPEQAAPVDGGRGLFSWFDRREAEEKAPSVEKAGDQRAAGEAGEEQELGWFDTPAWFERLKSGLSKTQESLSGGIDRLLLGKKQIDAETLEELEELLITSDFGMSATVDLVRVLEQRLKRNELKDAQALKGALKEEIRLRLAQGQATLDVSASSPFVILVVGVNGAGKTTTIGKLAARFTAEGRKTLVVAGDTFRAAAIDQLEVWGERAGVEVIRHREGADPAAVIFDGCRAAVARGVDVLLIDTAGRLHTKVNLMEELKKIRRVVTREIPGAPHETLLVLDAATGQNAVSQAKIFKEAADVTGVALTKLDGTAKGGVVVAIRNEFGLPVRYIGIGERIEDLRDFDPNDFVNAIFP